MKILAPTRYPWQFNGPRQSRHTIFNRNFLPVNKLLPNYEGVTLFSPSLEQFELIHAFNRIPIGTTPYVIGFESHLPRGFGIEKSWFYRQMLASLRSDRCRAIVSISECASQIFLDNLGDDIVRDQLAAKLMMRYPNLACRPQQSVRLDGPCRLVFVGAHFARKGGLVALEVAQQAIKQGLDLQIDLISSLQMGGNIWTDPTRPTFYEPYRKLLQLPNITLHGALPNSKVLEIVGSADYSLLPTFGDTFGYSALESMACGTPVIATDQGALSEFIVDNENGFLLPLETNRHKEWIHSGSAFRGESTFEKMFSEELLRLSHGVFRIIKNFKRDEGYFNMRSNARETIAKMNDPIEASTYWDDLYDQVT